MKTKRSTRISNQSSNSIFPDSKRSNSHSDIVVDKLFPMSKRSQVMPFIVIGLILLAGITIFLIARENIIVDKKVIVPVDINPVYSYVQTCAKQTLSDGVDYVSQKGGYYDTPDNTSDLEIAYYLYKGKNQMPTKERVEEEISSYVNNELQFCLNEFDGLEEFKIESGNVSSIVKIEDNRVLLKMNYPLSITKGEKTYALDEFEAEINVRLGIVYNIAKQIIDEQIKDTEIICIGCLYDLGVKNDVFIKTLDYNEYMVYTITDENSKINNKALVFNFVNKYN